jgi:tRNA pseudouridine-54 N-methylase
MQMVHSTLEKYKQVLCLHEEGPSLETSQFPAQPTGVIFVLRPVKGK